MTPDGSDSADLAGQVGIVTGGGRGIGREAALALAGAGMALTIIGRRPEPLHEVAETVRAAGGTALPVVADVTDRASLHSAIATTERTLGPVDLLVNNAGLIETAETPLWEADVDDLWDVVEVNLRGVIDATALVLRNMVARGCGRVVTLGSLAAVRGFGGLYIGYGVAKAGVLRMTRGVDESLRGTGVKVFDLSPGLVRTDMTDSLPIWQDIGDDEWTSPALTGRWLVAIASGRCDGLGGRFLHVEDDIETMVQLAGRIEEDDSRALTISPFGEADPIRPD